MWRGPPVAAVAEAVAEVDGLAYSGAKGGGDDDVPVAAVAFGGDEKKARRAKTKDGEPSTKSSSKARSPSAPSSLKRGGVHGGVEAAKSASPARNLLLR